MKCMGNDGTSHRETPFYLFDHFSWEKTFDDQVLHNLLVTRPGTQWNEYFRKILILTFHPMGTRCTTEPGHFKYQGWNPVNHLRPFFLPSGKLVHLFFLEYFITQCIPKELHQSRLTWKQSLCRFSWMSESW